MSYWDTSTLVKLYVKEPDSVVFKNYDLELRTATRSAPPVTCWLTLYEARAVFHQKESDGSLPTGAAEQLYTELLQDIAAGEIRLIEVAAELEKEYGVVLRSCYQQTPPIRLRTLDAIHLASAKLAGESEFVVTDARLRNAAERLGFVLFPT